MLVGFEIAVVVVLLGFGILMGFRLGYKNAQEHFLCQDEKFFDDLCETCPDETKEQCKIHVKEVTDGV